MQIQVRGMFRLSIFVLMTAISCVSHPSRAGENQENKTSTVSSKFPIYSSEQGAVVVLNRRVIVLEGISGQEFVWLASQYGIQAISWILFNAITYTFHRNSNQWAESDARYYLQLFLGGLLPGALGLGVLAREAWKGYWEAGLWAVFASQVPTNLLMARQNNVYGLAALASISWLLSAVRHHASKAHTGIHRVSLGGPEAAHLLVQMDFDTDIPEVSTRLIISRIEGSTVSWSNRSALSSLGMAMEQYKIPSLEIEVHSQGVRNLPFFTVSYQTPQKTSVVAEFEVDDLDRDWLLNKIHRKAPASEWSKSRSVLTPAALRLMEKWLDFSSGKVSRFPYGDVTSMTSDASGSSCQVTPYRQKGFTQVSAGDESSVMLGTTCRLYSGSWLSEGLHLQTSDSPESYVQYRIPRWINQLLLTTASSLGQYAVRKGVDFATEKLLSDGWSMDDLNQNILAHGKNAQGRRFSMQYAHESEERRAHQALGLNHGCAVNEVNAVLARQVGENQSISQAAAFLNWFIPNRDRVTIVNDNSSYTSRLMYEHFKDYVPRPLEPSH